LELTRRGKPHLPPAITTADLRKNIVPVTSSSNASTVINKPDESSHCGERYTVGVGWEKIPDEELPKEPSERHMSISEEANHPKDAALGMLDLLRVMLKNLIENKKFAKDPDFLNLLRSLREKRTQLRIDIKKCEAIPTDLQKDTIRKHLAIISDIVFGISHSVMALESEDLGLKNLNSYFEASRIYIKQESEIVNVAEILARPETTEIVESNDDGFSMTLHL
jgi:phosphopentomutase